MMRSVVFRIRIESNVVMQRTMEIQEPPDSPPQVVACATVGDELSVLPEVSAYAIAGDEPGPPVVTLADDDDELGDDEELEGVETPDFEGLEDFDDEDFDDEFDDDFEEELEDEYDFDEFDERVTEEDLEEAEADVPLVGDFVDEDEEEEKVVEEEPKPPEPETKKKPKGKKGRRASGEDSDDGDE